MQYFRRKTFEDHPSMLKVSAPLEKTYLGHTVYQTLLENILSGALPSGVEVSEVALAAELRVSRTPVHEAVKKLAMDGLLVHESGRRPRVARLDRAAVAELYEMRSILECAAAERAAERIDLATVRELGRKAEDLEARKSGDSDWRKRALEFDQLFHEAIATAAGSGRLREDIHRYRLLVRAFCRITGTAENLRAALGEHQTILKALRSRDPAAARKAMAAHISARVGVVLKEAFPEAR
jgi:DNA-binding GntR family transcriptional regulator